jgi:hypothetical protein
MNYSISFHVSHHDRNNFSRQPHSRLPKTKRPDVFIDCQIGCEDTLLETINLSQSESDLLLPPLLPQKINPRAESLIPRIPHFPFKNHLENTITSDLYHVLYLHQAIRPSSCETLSYAPHGASILRGSWEREKYDITQFVFTFGLITHRIGRLHPAVLPEAPICLQDQFDTKSCENK